MITLNNTESFLGFLGDLLLHPDPSHSLLGGIGETPFRVEPGPLGGRGEPGPLGGRGGRGTPGVGAFASVTLADTPLAMTSHVAERNLHAANTGR